MATLTLDTALHKDLRYQDMKPMLREAVYIIAARLEEYGDGALTDSQLRKHVLGPKRWEEFTRNLLKWGWLRRNEEDCLVRAGLLNKDTIRVREARSEGVQKPNKVRTNGEHAEPLLVVETAQEPHAQANSIKLEFNSIEDNYLELNSIEFNSPDAPELQGGFSSVTAAPPATEAEERARQRNKIGSALVSEGLTHTEASESLEKRTLSELEDALACLHAGYWSKDIPADVTLKNFIAGKLKLHSKYLKAKEARAQLPLPAAGVISSQPGGARASPLENDPKYQEWLRDHGVNRPASGGQNHAIG